MIATFPAPLAGLHTSVALRYTTAISTAETARAITFPVTRSIIPLVPVDALKCVQGSNARLPSLWVEHAGSRRICQDHACVRRWRAGTHNHQTACGSVFAGGTGDAFCKIAIGSAIHGFRSGQS